MLKALCLGPNDVSFATCRGMRRFEKIGRAGIAGGGTDQQGRVSLRNKRDPTGPTRKSPAALAGLAAARHAWCTARCDRPILGRRYSATEDPPPQR
jgi:hypothetical protein